MKELLIESSSPFRNPAIQIDGNLEYDRVSVIDHDKKQIITVFVGEKWGEEKHQSKITAQETSPVSDRTMINSYKRIFTGLWTLEDRYKNTDMPVEIKKIYRSLVTERDKLIKRLEILIKVKE